jgi:hypothetical protein
MWRVGMAQNLLRGKKRLPCHKGFKNAAERGLKVHVNPPDFPGEIKGLCNNPHTTIKVFINKLNEKIIVTSTGILWSGFKSQSTKSYSTM